MKSELRGLREERKRERMERHIGDESNKRFSFHPIDRFFKLNQQIVFKMLMNMLKFIYRISHIISTFSIELLVCIDARYCLDMAYILDIESFTNVFEYNVAPLP